MEKYVMIGNIKHHFTTEKEKKSLIKKAKATGSYTIVEGCLRLKVCSETETCNIVQDCGRAKDNSNK